MIPVQFLTEEINAVSTQLPLVTIITPAYNRASFLDETIQSVLAQDYPNIEYIILDDGSTDNTGEVLEKYKGRIYWETHPNMGETHTVNKGFKMARGEIVCVVNSDDPLLPGAVSAAVALMRERPDVLAAYPDWNEIGPRSEFIKRMQLPDYDIFNMLKTFNVSMGPGTFIRRQAFDLVGVRDPRFKYAGDLEYWFRIALHGRLAHIQETLATHRTHPDSASVSDRGAKMAEELVWVAQKVYAHPNLPSKVRGLHDSVFGFLHYEAASYCGFDRRAAIKHYMISMGYAPFKFLRRLFINVRHESLRLIWHRWRAWRQSSRSLDSGKTVIRFAFLSHVLPPSWSGQAVIIERLLRRLDPARYCLISRQNYGSATNQVNVSSRLPANYHSLSPELHVGMGARFGLFYVNSLFQTLQRARHIAQIAMQEQSQAIVACSGDLVDPPAGHLASLWTGIKYYLYVFDDYVNQWTTPMQRSFAKWFEPILVKGAAKVIVPNEYLRDEYRRRYGIEPVVIHNPCDEAVIELKQETPWPTKQGEIRIVYTGAVYHAHYDAFRNLLAALRLIGRPEIKLHLYTAQSAELLEKQEILGPIVHHDHLVRSQVMEVQQKADILFLPLAFNSPIPEVVKTSAPAKMGEYMATGRPILIHAPPDCFLSQYFIRHECGLVVDRNDPERLKQAICRLIDDGILRRHLRNNAMMQAQSDFSLETARVKFSKLFLSEGEGTPCASCL
jgi:glycosyltransferase involved in cell wall biosynthesis